MTKRKPGRPSTYSEEVAEAIVTRLANGEPLAVICREEEMPSVTTVWNWQRSKPEFSESIACARETGFDVIAYRSRQTARGKTSKENGDSSGDVQRDKLIIETDLKLLAKWDPKRYGDKLGLEHSGEIVTMTPEQRQARIAELMAKHAADGS